MTNNIIITANWADGTLSSGMVSRQYDNNRYVVQFTNYPLGEDEDLSLYLIVWMKTEENGQPVEQAPIELDSDQWIVTNYYTQFVQSMQFQLCVRNESGTFEAHSPIFNGNITKSLSHDGSTQEIYVAPLFDAYKEYVDELVVGAGAVVIDDDLNTSGAAADAKATGDALAGLNGRLGDLEGGVTGGLTEEIKSALLACFRNVVWEGADPTGQSYISALQTALYPPVNLSRITAVYSGGSVSESANLDSLKSDLVVTAYYSDSTSEVVTSYTLSGTLAEGTSTITASYGGKTATFSVTVTGVAYKIRLADNDFLMVNKASGGGTDNQGLSTAPSILGKRRAFLTDESNGIAPLKETADDTTWTDTIYYPIKIPARATSVTVGIVPKTQYIAIYVLQYIDGVYTRVEETGWVQGEGTLAFAASNENYLLVFSKYNNGGTTNYTSANEPTDLAISYSYDGQTFAQHHDFMTDGSDWELQNTDGTITKVSDTELSAAVTKESWNLVAKRGQLSTKLYDILGQTCVIEFDVSATGLTSGGANISAALTGVQSGGNRQSYGTVGSNLSSGHQKLTFPVALSTYTNGDGTGTYDSYMTFWFFFRGNAGANITLSNIEIYTTDPEDES